MNPARTALLGLLVAVCLLLITPRPFLADEQPILNVHPAELQFHGAVDGSATYSQTLTISNEGRGPMTWEARTDAEWITLGASGGTLNGGRSAQLLVIADPEGLEAGTYQGMIAIVAPQASGSPVGVRVALELVGSHQRIADFDDCRKAPPEFDWGSFSVDNRGTASDTCGLDTVDPDERGNVVWISYDVSPVGSQSGFWVKFASPEVDPARLDALYLDLRSAREAGTLGPIGVELKLRGAGFGWRKAQIRSISSEWQRVLLPLSRFERFEPWNATDEIALVFDHASVTPRQGTIVVDRIGFVLGEEASP